MILVMLSHPNLQMVKLYIEEALSCVLYEMLSHLNLHMVDIENIEIVIVMMKLLDSGSMYSAQRVIIQVHHLLQML